MAKKLSDAAKTAFIEENIDLVPVKSRDNFNSKKLDEKYTLMTNYVRKNNERHTIKGQLKSYLKSKNCQYKEVKELQKICDDWIKTNKKKIIDKFNKEEERIRKEKQEILDL